MRFIRDIHAEKEATGKPTISFEFFPFKTSEGDVGPGVYNPRPKQKGSCLGSGVIFGGI